MQDSAAVVIVDGPDPARPSLWTPLAGRIILARTVNVFEASPLIQSIILVLAAEDIARANKLCRDEGWRKITGIIARGTSRQASVRSSLDTLAEAPRRYRGGSGERNHQTGAAGTNHRNA